MPPETTTTAPHTGGIALAREHLAAAVEDALDERLDDDPALLGVADDDHALRRVEVLVHVARPDHVRRVRRIAQVEGLRARDQTQSAAGLTTGGFFVSCWVGRTYS